MRVDDFERRECTVNSSELAGHGRALQRSKHQLLTPTVRTPKCVHNVWGKIFYNLIGVKASQSRQQNPEGARRIVFEQKARNIYCENSVSIWRRSRRLRLPMRASLTKDPVCKPLPTLLLRYSFNVAGCH